MIAILTSKTDISTSEVENWLLHYHADYIRLNGEEGLSDFSMFISTNEKQCMFKHQDSLIDLNSILAFWYRRDSISILTSITVFPSLTNFFKTEYWTVTNFLDKTLENKPSIGSFEKEKFTNKLLILSAAVDVGLDIPKTLITTLKKEALDFVNAQQTITKALNINFSTLHEGFSYSVNSTKEVRREDIEKMNDTFALSLLQQKLDKKYELRVFYLNDTFYTMAIFSQLDEKTALDFRMYNNDKPNRCVPYALPKTIELKLLNLMRSINMNTGSIDIVVTKDNRYVFLEVNHVGQFGWLSENCNYFIEKHIAQQLINLSKK
jgi:ATP-GRASP peptide maturase of grasp-with-spasm system